MLHLILLGVCLCLAAVTPLQCDYLPKQQIEGLIAFYNATNGPSWDINSQLPWNFTGIDPTSPIPCTAPWAGVKCTCDIVNRAYQVQILDFDFLSITGSIPPEIAYFSNLESLFLQNNLGLKGSIPDSLGQLTGLKVLYIFYTNISGSIPSTIGNLKSIRTMLLHSNMLTGSIPDELGNATTLEYLMLDDNLLTGTIPSSIKNLKYLISISLSTNMIRGTIPSEIGYLTALESFRLISNELIGTIPSSVNTMLSLKDFTVQLNLLSGSIPSSMENLTNLRTLNVRNNHLTGTIPSEIFHESLQNLYLSDNSLFGSIPQALGNSYQLVNLHLVDNYFIGSIPKILTNLTKLSFLQVYNNYLTGFIPEGIEDFENLVSFSALLNFLTGTLPSLPWKSSVLEEIDIGGNYLTGTIPGSYGRIPSLKNLFLESNLLHGSIPNLMELSSIEEVSLSRNLLTNTIPETIGNLQALNIFASSVNYLSGTIPPSLFRFPNLAGAYLNNNLLSGQIPFEVSDSTAMEILWLFDNIISGSIPSTISSLHNLQELLLFGNKFTGRFFDIYGATETSLNSTLKINVVNIADNLFSGSISWDVSRLPYISSIIASSNCLTGPIPESTCRLNSSLTQFVFDVAGGNPMCHQNVALNQKKPVFFKGTFSELGLTGTLPSCLLELPNINTVHVAGNRLHGVLADHMMLGANMSSLVLSNNALAGTIPTSIQTHYFEELDLSNNRFDGTLIDGFVVSPRQTILGLSVNHLSGPLPSSLNNQNVLSINFSTFSVLATNTFNCNNKDIPSNDPDSKSYSCGSFDLNVSYIVFFTTLAAMFLGLILVKITSDLRLNFILETKLIEWYSRAWAHTESINETKGFLLAVLMIRNYALMLMCLCCAVLLPVYIALNVTGTGSIVSYQYGYVVSMAYLHSLGIVIFISAFLFAVLLIGRVCVSAFQSELSEYFIADQPLVHHMDSVYHICGIYLLVLALHLVNIAVTVCINALYVNAILNSSSIDQSQFLVLQIAISVFKVFWNGIYVPQVTKRLEKFITHSRAVQSRYVMSIVNFVVAPCVATMIVNQSCFYYAIVESNPLTVSSSTTNQNCISLSIIGSTCSISEIAFSMSSAFPPFHYSYACGTALLIAYIPVLFYVYLFYGLVLPVVRIFFAFDGMHKPGSLMGFNPNQIKGRSILADLLIHVTVLLTFGISSFALGVTISLALLVNAIVSISLVGRLMKEKQASSITNLNPMSEARSSQLDIQSTNLLLVMEYVDIRDSWRSVIVCADLVVFVVVTFWALLFFDMIADVYGWVSGVICSALFEVLVIGLMVAINNIFCLHFNSLVSERSKCRIRRMLQIDEFRFESLTKTSTGADVSAKSDAVELSPL